MAITFGAGFAPGGGGSGLTTFTYSGVTLTGSDIMLAVFVMGNSSDNITGVTWNGNALSLLTKENNLVRYNYVFYLTNAGAGTHDIVVSASSASIWAFSSPCGLTVFLREL